MKKIFENWRLCTQVSSPSEKNFKYFEKAIAEADTYDDFGWTMNDFNVEKLGMISLDELESIAPFGEWVRNELTVVDHLPPEERVQSIPEFDSPEKKEAALKYIKNPNIRPPVVLVTAPDSNNDDLYTRYGFGHGLINLNLALGLPTIEVFHLKYKHEVKKAPRGLAGPPGRLKDY